MIKTDYFTGEIFDERTGWVNKEDYADSLLDYADLEWAKQKDEFMERNE